MSEVFQKRLRFIGLLVVGLTSVIVVQLIQVQIFKHKFYASWARDLNIRTVVVSSSPPGVVRDRNGQLLIGNEVTYDIGMSPCPRKSVGEVAGSLAPVLHVPVSLVEQVITDGVALTETSTGMDYFVIAKDVSKEVGEEIAGLGIRFVKVDLKWRRVYPEGSLAAHTLGFCNADRSHCYGIEGFYDLDLQPRQVDWEGPVDAYGDMVPWAVTPLALPEAGAELTLSINRTIQLLAEQELAYSLNEYQAEAGTIIVMDPKTSEVLAMVSFPDYDPGHYQDYLTQESSPFVDPAVSKVYEPGSVFKILTVSAGLDSGAVTPETSYSDQGWIEVGGHTIRNASRQAYGEQTVADLLIKSLNVGSAWLATQMGADTFYRYVQGFGIGQLTRIDLDGEVAGALDLPEDTESWHEANLGTNSFGQGLAVTPMQMITAVSAVANGGQRMRPHVVVQRSNADGVVAVYQPVVEEQVISPETAKTLTDILVRVIDEDVPQAGVEGYRMAGKTGTAQIPVPGGYDKEGTIASFVGYGPVPDPQFVILVKLDRPKTSQWGSRTAALSFQRLASRLVVLFGIPPQLSELTEAVQ